MLASASPRRAALLAQAGIVPDAIVPVEISEIPRKGELAREHAIRLAQQKAATAAVAWRGTPALILAADTVVACGRRILPKALTDDEVRNCLALLSGRSHQVVTAIAVVPPAAAMRTRFAVTRVTFRRLAQDEVNSYVSCGEGIGKAGGYAIQGRAETYVRRINGSYSSVVGLPLRETVGLLESCGYTCI